MKDFSIMLTKKLTLLQNTSNVVSMSQADVDNYKLDDEDIQQFYDTVKLFSIKAKSDITYKYVDFHLKNNFKYLDLVKIPKYSLLSVYNTNTKKCLVNIGATLKTKASNINARDAYSMIVYSHVCSVLSVNQIKEYEPFCNYMCLMLLKIYSKKYGITGSYADLIPQFKFIIYYYTLVKFFEKDTRSAIKIASANCRFDVSHLNIPDIKQYDMAFPKEMIRLLSDTGTCPGLNLYVFVENIIRLFGTMNLAIYEDLMRFCAAMFTSTINSNSFFPVSFQRVYSLNDYNKINSIIESTLSK